RFARNQLMITENSRLGLGSPTFGWLHQAYRGMRQARRSAGHLICPVLLLVGTVDTVVSVPVMLSFTRGLSQGTVKRYAGARHEVLMERDEVRNEAIADILSFIDTIERLTDAADSVGAVGRQSPSKESS
ncbi:MAG: alpha/beta hydrolase, partial [Desulfofustis sp.]|nr:alpha/beta hydrolase [Desulfofustis sp.]